VTCHTLAPLTAPLRFLRRHHNGVLVADEVVYPRRFVLDSAGGKPVLTLPLGVEDAESIVLHIPDEGVPSLQLLAELEWLDPNLSSHGSATDRFLIHHAKTEDSRFAMLNILDAKWTDGPVAAEDLIVPNPLASIEPRLCKQLNTDRTRLASIVRQIARREVFDPIAVGVDPDGVTVRSRTGLVRLEFETSRSATDAETTIQAWIG